MPMNPNRVGTRAIVFKRGDGEVVRLRIEEVADADDRRFLQDVMATLPPQAMVLIDEHHRAFRLGSFEANGADPGDDDYQRPIRPTP